MTQRRSQETIKEIQKELNITIDEAMVLSIIMSYQIQDTYSPDFVAFLIKKVRFLKTHYKTIPSIEVAFANFKE